MQCTRGLPAGAELVLSDCQKKITDPEYKLKEKAFGLLPINPESPFGNFPRIPGEASPRKQLLSKTGQINPARVRLNNREKTFLRRGGGASRKPKSTSV